MVKATSFIVIVIVSRAFFNTNISLRIQLLFPNLLPVPLSERVNQVRRGVTYVGLLQMADVKAGSEYCEGAGIEQTDYQNFYLLTM